MVGGWIADGFTSVIGAAAYVAPVAFLAIGGLMVARSALVDVSPFRTGLIVTAVGLMTALGSAHGGVLGDGLGTLFGTLLGTTGTTIVGVLALVVGALLLSGASAGALVRRSGHAVRRAHTRARQARPMLAGRARAGARDSAASSRAAGRCCPRLPGRRRREPAAAAARRAGARQRPRPAEPVRRRRGRASPGIHASRPQHPARIAARERSLRRRRGAHRSGARPDAGALRRPGDDQRPDFGTARDALRAAARARHQGLEGRSAEGRSLLRARDDGDPHPRSDPGEAGGRSRGSEPVAESRHARRHLRRPAGNGQSARRVARQGHLGHGRLDRPRAHAAPPHRRHYRLR